MPKVLYCPFLTSEYVRKDGAHHIVCEQVSIKFMSNDAYSGFICKFCASQNGWHNCPIAVSTLNEYERIDK